MAAKIIQSNNNVGGFFEPVTQDPIYNWIWADVNNNKEEEDDFDNYDNYNQDDLRDPDMTTIGEPNKCPCHLPDHFFFTDKKI